MAFRDEEIDRIMAGLAYVETRDRDDPYSIYGKPLVSGKNKGSKALGKYQIMDFNLPSWSKAVYGESLTEEEFMGSPEAQEAIARHEASRLYDLHGSAGDVASVWRSGKTLAQGGAGRFDPTSKQYGDKYFSIFERGYGRNPVGAASSPAGAVVEAQASGTPVGAVAETQASGTPAQDFIRDPIGHLRGLISPPQQGASGRQDRPPRLGRMRPAGPVTMAQLEASERERKGDRYRESRYLNPLLQQLNQGVNPAARPPHPGDAARAKQQQQNAYTETQGNYGANMFPLNRNNPPIRRDPQGDYGAFPRQPSSPQFNRQPETPVDRIQGFGRTPQQRALPQETGGAERDPRVSGLIGMLMNMFA